MFRKLLLNNNYLLTQHQALKCLIILALTILASLAMKGQSADNWMNDPDIILFQESEIVYGGDYSAGIIVNSQDQSNCDLINESEIQVNAGESFEISFWGITSQHVYVRVFFYWIGTNNNFTQDYLGPGSETWENFTYEGIVPNGASALNLGFRFYDVTGFQPGELQYLDDVTFQSPIGVPLLVENGNFENWETIKPEPSEYPTEFSGTQKSLSAMLSWASSGGDQLPDSYLILGAIGQMTTIPEDGVYYLDDVDFSDGEGAVNLAFGADHHTFTNLNALSNYHFMIFPYTNSGTSVNYKTDGIPPETSVEIPDVTVVNEQNFDTSWTDWQTISITGSQVWSRENNSGIQETPCARISGNQAGTIFENHDWLISPTMDFSLYENEFMSFYSSVGGMTQEEQFAVKVSVDYTGTGDPESATWIDLNPVLPDGSQNWTWVNSAEISLSDFESESVHIAFVYTCGTESAATWQVDNVLITGEKLPLPEPTNYPTMFSAYAYNTNIDITWIESPGGVPADAYLIACGDQQNITPPTDGIPIQDDNDYSDGAIFKNVQAGNQSATFQDLISGKFYHFSIFPYTNSGENIDYKTDSIAPSSYVFINDTIDFLFTDYNNSWGGWIPLSLVGAQVWSRNNTSGPDNSACATFDNTRGENAANEDWLLSPPLELLNTANAKTSFYNARQNSGQGLKFKISTDYDGVSNPNEFTWIDLTDRANWSEGDFNWTFSGSIDLSEFSGNTVHLAFLYISNQSENITWGIDNVSVWEIPELDGPTNHPTNFSVAGNRKQIIVTWTDAIGEILPWGYLLQISDEDDLLIPADGFQVEEDTDFSDGKGAVHVLPGTGQFVFDNLADSTTYYVSNIPYSYPNDLIRYKTSPAPPADSAMTAAPNGISYHGNQGKFIIYPNPGNGFFRFEADREIQSLEFYSIQGELLFSKDIKSVKGHIDLSHFDKGIYLMAVKSGNVISFKKQIIIQ